MLQVEVKLQHPSVEHTAISALPVLVPLSVHDLEGDVFVRRSCGEADDTQVLAPVRIVLEPKRGCHGRIHQVWVEDVEPIPLHDTRGWVLRVVVSSVVLGPLVACLDPIEVQRLSNGVLVVPERALVVMAMTRRRRGRRR